ncbi:ribonuclease HI [Thermosporothrix hazakensis]|uniref:ribonuclease H n=2 Tax=Thermosporothrix TaxID=768650 RepID=A0A326UD64_THEHA|nr:RNase H family protein [Thermosporothrix hazakensis]PZW35974.1 ribonuclease HI [Thermosporothrix hazakensis]BBH88443.1 hypothetical protein KTC_31940 [Thermosporothrix sp. COM3]GCE46629.1 hypothetical protein KTH_14980 [Thermosporothrix hazakensis]
MSTDVEESLEWDSVKQETVHVDLRAALPALGKDGVVAFTDGACIKNPGGPAGWAALLWARHDMTSEGVLRPNASCLECYGHVPCSRTTTNNRAEIAAVLAVLALAPPQLPLTIYSDSEYTIKVASGIYQMKANPDLWAIYRKLASYRQKPPVFVWVRGHIGQKQNERADELAGLGAFQGNRAAFERWRTSQTPEARNGLSTTELATLRKQVQRLHAYFEAQDPTRISARERQFIADMAKRMRKDRFVLSEKQKNWLYVLLKKYWASIQ